MLTDGQRTTGVDPLEAAKMAAERGVRVYTVGIGMWTAKPLVSRSWSMRVRLDEETLKSVAQRTQAEYFYAGTAADLKKVYETLSTRLTVEKKETEVSGLFALVGAVLALLSATLSLCGGRGAFCGCACHRAPGYLVPPADHPHVARRIRFSRIRHIRPIQQWVLSHPETTAMTMSLLRRAQPCSAFSPSPCWLQPMLAACGGGDDVAEATPSA